MPDVKEFGLCDEGVREDWMRRGGSDDEDDFVRIMREKGLRIERWSGEVASKIGRLGQVALWKL